MGRYAGRKTYRTGLRFLSWVLFLEHGALPTSRTKLHSDLHQRHNTCTILKKHFRATQLRPSPSLMWHRSCCCKLPFGLSHWLSRVRILLLFRNPTLSTCRPQMHRLQPPWSRSFPLGWEESVSGWLHSLHPDLQCRLPEDRQTSFKIPEDRQTRFKIPLC